MLKCDWYKRPLRHKRIDPAAFVRVESDSNAFQGYKIVKLADIKFPFLLGEDAVIIDFGDHYTGYLQIALDNGTEDHIADSPANLVFRFAEMPVELAEEIEKKPNSLSVGWAQKDFKTVAFMPYQGSLERRYSFRYVEIKRVDSVYFPIKVQSLSIDSVSAVDVESAKKVEIKDELLRKIDAMCVKTLAECEQDVFEDGPKRDRRLWIGDLRLQALVDYETFGNTDLIKRCIYLFAEHRNQKGLVAPCVFPDTPPYVDQWIYLDYSLCLIPCIYDYMIHTGDTELAEELYSAALQQAEYADSVFNREERRIDAPFFIDHAGFDRTIAALGYYSYVLRRLLAIARRLCRETERIEGMLADSDRALFSYFDPESGFFVAENGEISWHSQTWAALSGALSVDRAADLLKRTVEKDPEIRFSSPFMMHYYLEALFQNGLAETALARMKEYWGAMLAAGFDCCPECFQPGNDRLTPYVNLALNSACHAWSCTPAYWIRRYYANELSAAPESDRA